MKNLDQILIHRRCFASKLGPLSNISLFQSISIPRELTKFLPFSKCSQHINDSILIEYIQQINKALKIKNTLCIQEAFLNIETFYNVKLCASLCMLDKYST